jgi:hypothetical protein
MLGFITPRFFQTYSFSSSKFQEAGYRSEVKQAYMKRRQQTEKTGYI